MSGTATRLRIRLGGANTDRTPARVRAHDFFQHGSQLARGVAGAQPGLPIVPVQRAFAMQPGRRTTVAADMSRALASAPRVGVGSADWRSEAEERCAMAIELGLGDSRATADAEAVIAANAV